MHRSEAWFVRQLAHAEACIAEASKQHTQEEVAAAHAALAVMPSDAQKSMFEQERKHGESA